MHYLMAHAFGSCNAKTQNDIATALGINSRAVRMEIRRLRIERGFLIPERSIGEYPGYFIPDPASAVDKSIVEDYLRRIKTRAIHEIQNYKPQRKAYRMMFPEQLSLLSEVSNG